MPLDNVNSLNLDTYKLLYYRQRAAVSQCRALKNQSDGLFNGKSRDELLSPIVFTTSSEEKALIG
jgi:hypothetical protein